MTDIVLHQAPALQHRAYSSLDIRRQIRLIQPQSPKQLHAYIRLVLGFTVPRSPIVPGHTAPFEYVLHAFDETCQPRDCIVWANRGGGKTQLGAIVTLLEILFKPGIQIRILGGSMEQSSKMYLYLKHLLEDDCFIDLIDGNITGKGATLVNGSRVEVLSQSERAVRGQRVHKLRCDEVELFQPEIWEAAQLITRSGQCGDVLVHGAIESLSTMHRPYGMMQKLIQRADEQNRRIFRWSVLDTLEKCPPQRECESCMLFADCAGAAKRASGFIAIDDAVQQMHRVGPETWQSEMLCERPSLTDVVYPSFKPAMHVRCFHVNARRRDIEWIGGVDFGFRALTVFLWAFVDAEQRIWIVDELAVAERTTERIIQLAEKKSWPRPTWIGADPAGHQRQEHTGVSTITLWRRAGWNMTTRRTLLEPGIAMVSRQLQAADGTVSLFIHERCEHLIAALQQYHYPPQTQEDTQPVKDGNDHAADALRYMIVNHNRRGGVEVRGY